MDMPLEARSFFEHPDIVKTEDDLQRVSESARLAFALMEPWQQVRCNYEPGFVKSTIDCVVEQANNYYSAITDSLETAQDGSLVAEDAITLCNMISSGTDTVGSITAFLKDMLELANKGHARADATTSQFRAIRVALFQISKSISDEVHIAETEPSTEDVDPMNTHFIELPDPILLPEGEVEYKAAVMNRSAVSQSFKEIITQLNQLNQDLAHLTEYVGGFVNWWMGMVTKLEALQKVIPQIKLDKSNPIRTDDVRRRWGEVQVQYDAYSRHVKAIQDSYRNLSRNESLPSTPHRTIKTNHNVSQGRAAPALDGADGRGEVLTVSPSQEKGAKTVKRRFGGLGCVNSCSSCVIM